MQAISPYQLPTDAAMTEIYLNYVYILIASQTISLCLEYLS